MFEGLKADGFDDCVVGVGRQFNHDVVVYDQDKIIKKLADDLLRTAKILIGKTRIESATTTQRQRNTLSSTSSADTSV